MPQLEGGITVDQGYRVGIPDTSSSSTSSSRRSFDPANHPNESLGVEVYGAEEWVAPGFGEPHPDCGTFRVEGICESCGEAHVAPHQCGRRVCPDCWGIWAKQAGMKRTKRLQEIRYTEGFKQAAHGVVSLDREIQTVRGYLEGRRRAAEIAKEKGWRHFDVVAHPWRVNDEGKELYREEAGESAPGIHVWLREEYPGRYHFGCSNSLLEWAPHYHIIGVTSPGMEPAKESDDYVYQFFDSFAPFDLHQEESYNQVYGAYRYLLSHIGVHTERQFQAVVGYGGMSNTTHGEYEPSVGIQRMIEEMVEKVADSYLEEEEESVARAGADEDELGECRECGEGVVINIFRVPDYLEQAEPPPDIRNRMMIAYKWRTGEICPPAGLKNPRTPADAREAFEELVAFEEVL